jgi:hypothetical protein
MAITRTAKANMTLTITTFDGKKEVSQQITKVEIPFAENLVSWTEWKSRSSLAEYILKYGILVLP